MNDETEVHRETYESRGRRFTAERPRIAMSTGSMRENPTGSWRHVRPVHLEDQLAPCRQSCPIGVSIPAFVHLLEGGRPDQAWLKILESNPLPGVAGRVCYHPCESSCFRATSDDAVRTHALERFVADSNLNTPLPFSPPVRARSQRVAIVGSGPAGLSCAYQLARRQYRVVLFESEARPGGILRSGIPPYRLPRDILDKEIADILNLGIRLELNTTLGVDLDWVDLQAFSAIFLATGAHRARRLNLPGEESDGVLSGLEFLKAVNAGYPRDLGKRVLVIGGGNTAIDAARTALRLGSSVTLLYRRSRKEMPAVPDEVEAARGEGVQFRFLTQPVSFLSRDGRVRGVEAQKMELGDSDATGRKSPVSIPESNLILHADSVLIAVGEEPETRYLPNRRYPGGGFIPVGDQQETERTGVFAGGDVTARGKGTVAHAIRSGKIAAEAIHRRLSGETGTAVPPRLIEADQIESAYFRKMPSTRLPVRECPSLINDFEEIHLGLDSPQALDESARCFQCGICTRCNNCLLFCPDMAVRLDSSGSGYEIDLEHCKGCGICAAECPRGIIMMVREEGA